jgi:hypothetical protein
MDPLTALAALLPLAVEAGKAAINRWIVPDTIKPGTFAEFLELRRLEVDQWRAMQGGDGISYPWVEAIRQLQRPAFAAAVVGVWAWQASTAVPSDTVANMAGAVGFYLFGDRTLFHIKTGAK